MTCHYCPLPATWRITAGRVTDTITLLACRKHANAARGDAAPYGPPTIVELDQPGRAA